MATVFAPVQSEFQQPYRPEPQRIPSSRAERAERRESQGLTPASGASPVLTSNQASHYQPPRARQVQGIESALAMSLEIPPYNPAKRKSQTPSPVPSTPAPASLEQQAYPSPSSIPRPGTSSSQRSNSSNGSAPNNQSSSRNTTTNRPTSTSVVPVPYTPEALAYSTAGGNRRDAATTGARTKADRNTHTIAVAAPHTTGHANPAEKTQGMGIYQPPPSGGNSGRPKIFFGPYQLLQTLGEGEFGKVKLGVRGDARWGEEVAIKLIKRGSVQESATRMTKVVREIDVLKIVKHPNIVRLHDVIETERYIGIVLEYASGGELFDHILAHRYLKDRDASKLFAQLISGVAYLHAKKIIHRDLKLENLLLDRNRNIIITDFGFANRFEDKGNDLMATSCGSPCYAAPELVVQDGKYVGSAVDVWSCGVILYAMLAGYLPFDDDPLNPDSENINLLYKYIMNTPLSFPEWITPEPRDLLQRMLVPDPTKRCTLQDVAQHRWLRKYVSLFDRTVEDLEELAAEQDNLKRQMLDRQKDAVLHQEQAVHMTRSQTSAGMRPQSAMVTSSTMQPLFASAAPSSPSRPGPSASSNRRAHAHSAIVVPTMASRPEASVPEMDPFALSSQSPTAVPMSVSISAPSRTEAVVDDQQQLIISQQDRKRTPSGEQEMPKAKSQRTSMPDDAEERERERKSKAKAHRYTVQVEYAPEPVPLPSKPMEDKTGPVSQGLQLQTSLADKQQEILAEPVAEEASNTQAVSPIPGILLRENTPPADSPVQSEFGVAESVASSAAADLGHSSSNLDYSASILPQSIPAEQTTTPPASSQTENVPFPPSPEKAKSDSNSGSAPHAQVTRTASGASRPPSSASTTSKHRKGGSSDRFSISRLLGSSNSLAKQASKGESNDQVEALDEVTNNKRKGARRKAFSLVVEPFKPASSSTSTRSTKRSSVQASNNGSATSKPPTDRPRTRSSVALETTPAQGAVHAPSSVRSTAPSVNTTTTRRGPSQTSTTTSQNPASVSSGPPAGKAKRVMDWFRWRSMPRDSALNASQSPAPISTDFDRSTHQSQHQRVTRASVARQQAAEKAVQEESKAEAPQVVVTDSPTEVKALPASVEASPTTTESHLPPIEAATLPVPAAVPNIQRSASVTSALASEPFNEARLRFHQGAVDQNALTYKSPPVVLVDIRKVLWAMGIEVREEAGPFRLKCTRRSSKKVAASHGVSINAVHAGSLASSVGPASSLGPSAGSIGPAGSERLDGRTGLPASPSMGLTPSPSSTFRAFFGRRSSTNSVVTSGGYPSPALTNSTNALDSPDLLLSPLAKSTSNFNSNAPLPFYGKQDSGAELRFTVEISRMKNLPKLYAVDVRRLKGELWGYKDIYTAILERLELGE